MVAKKVENPDYLEAGVVKHDGRSYLLDWDETHFDGAARMGYPDTRTLVLDGKGGIRWFVDKDGYSVGLEISDKFRNWSVLESLVKRIRGTPKMWIVDITSANPRKDSYLKFDHKREVLDWIGKMRKTKNPVMESMIGGMAAGTMAGLAGAYMGARMAREKNPRYGVSYKAEGKSGRRSAFFDSEADADKWIKSQKRKKTGSQFTVVDTEEFESPGQHRILKRVNPPKDPWVIKVWMKQVENGEKKEYEYTVASKRAATKKVMDFVMRMGHLWEAYFIVDNQGYTEFEAGFDASTGKWTVHSDSRMGVKNLKARNPANHGQFSAEAMSRSFHGREIREWLELEEDVHIDDELAVLGVLTEIEIRLSEDEVLPIVFGKPGKLNVNPEKDVLLCSNPEGTQLYLVGGDQDVSQYFSDFKQMGINVSNRVRTAVLGDVYSVSYYTDKHHLSGPASQKKGAHYVHKLGEESGIEPKLVMDNVNKKLQFVGGDYEVRDVGIWN